MVLSDTSIRHALKHGYIKMEPAPQDAAIQPASVDVHLDWQFMEHGWDPVNEIPVISGRNCLDSPFVLRQGQFLLGQTMERLTLSDVLCANVEGISTGGRLGLQVHSTAGFIDPGFSGTITLEICNNSPIPIELTYGMRIGQIKFQQLSAPTSRPYGSEGLGSKYQNQSVPTAALIEASNRRLDEIVVNSISSYTEQYIASLKNAEAHRE